MYFRPLCIWKKLCFIQLYISTSSNCYYAYDILFHCLDIDTFDTDLDTFFDCIICKNDLPPCEVLITNNSNNNNEPKEC